MARASVLEAAGEIPTCETMKQHERMMPDQKEQPWEVSDRVGIIVSANEHTSTSADSPKAKQRREIDV